MTSVGVMASSVVISVAPPVIATVNTEIGTSMGTNNPIPAPAGVVAGNLLVATVTLDTPGVAITASTGWTEVIQSITVASPLHRMATFARIADGGANDIFSVSGDAHGYCASILRITGHGVTSIATHIKSAGVVGNGTNADPPSLNTGSVKKWLWLVPASLDQNTGGQIITEPAGYTLCHAILQSAANIDSLGVASRAAEVQTEDPAVWTSAGRPWNAFTIAIPPA